MLTYPVLTRAGFEVKSAGVQLKNEEFAELAMTYPRKVQLSNK
jgi:hypothetical protein